MDGVLSVMKHWFLTLMWHLSCAPVRHSTYMLTHKSKPWHPSPLGLADADVPCKRSFPVPFPSGGGGASLHDRWQKASSAKTLECAQSGWPCEARVLAQHARHLGFYPWHTYKQMLWHTPLTQHSRGGGRTIRSSSSSWTQPGMLKALFQKQ